MPVAAAAAAAAAKEDDLEVLGRVRVAIRVRPLFPHARRRRQDAANDDDDDDDDDASFLPLEGKEGGSAAVSCADPRTVELTAVEAGGVRSVKKFDADLVAHEGFGQEDLFRHCGAPALLDSAYDGMKVTVFAYGATGSGKTHTILGPGEEAAAEETPDRDFVEEVDPVRKSERCGLIERGARYLFGKARGQQGAADLRLVASFYEIYNEQVFDLLATSKTPLKVKHNVTHGFFVPGLVELECLSAEDVTAVVAEGRRSRRRAAHKLNRDSSRGHALLRLRVVLGTSSRGKVNFVDLAGNERLERSETSDAQETGSINRSLFALGKVIAALTTTDRKVGHVVDKNHVPYRDSTLTKLLMDSLGGEVFTLMIACLSPAAASVDESLCTLQYARRAKGILNAPKVSLLGQPAKPLVDEATASELAALRREVAALREENKRLRQGGHQSPARSTASSLAAKSPGGAPAPPHGGGGGGPHGDAFSNDDRVSTGRSSSSHPGARHARRRRDPPSMSPADFSNNNNNNNNNNSSNTNNNPGAPPSAAKVDELQAQLRALQQSYAVLEAKLDQNGSHALHSAQQQWHAQQQWYAHQQQQQQQWDQHQAALQHQQQADYIDEYNRQHHPQQHPENHPRHHQHPPHHRAVVDVDSQDHVTLGEARNAYDGTLTAVRYQKTGDVVRRHRDDLTF